MMFAGVHDEVLDRVCDFRPGNGAGGRDLVARLPLHHSACALVQKIGELMMWPFNALTEWWDPKSQLTEKDISPLFLAKRHHAEFDRVRRVGCREALRIIVLRVDGLVESP